MPTNDFLPFATGGGANVESQAAYLADTDRPLGNQPGVASSAFNNKALRQGTFITSQVAQLVSNILGADVLDGGVNASFLGQLTAALQAFPPKVTKYASGSGTHSITRIFMIASGNATATATYTNNGNTFTVLATISAGTILYMTGNGAPSVSGTLTKSGGTGDSTITFYAVRSPIAIEVQMVGGGGGGCGVDPAATHNGGNGGDSSFGTSLLTASGGGGGTAGSQPSAGGAASLGTGPTGIALTGGTGNAGTATLLGGAGGSSPFGGAGGSVYKSGAQAGVAAATNTGSGGSGATNTTVSGNGGSAGGYIDAYITSPLSQYAYVVGAAGTAGTGSDAAGGAGGSGLIIVKEIYQ